MLRLRRSYGFLTSPTLPKLLGQISIDAKWIQKGETPTTESPPVVISGGWYELLSRKRTASEVDAGIEQFKNTVVQQFQSAQLTSTFNLFYNRSLTRYGERKGLRLDDIVLSKQQMLSTSESRRKAFRIRKMVKRLEQLFTSSRQVPEVIRKRAKLGRQVPDFYIHQQFVIYQTKGSLAEMLHFYFLFPKPRALHLTAAEFQKLMDLVLRQRVNEQDHIRLCRTLVRFFGSLLEDRIPLTEFELTKYVLFYLVKCERLDGCSVDECFDKVVRLRSSFVFSAGTWNFLLNRFPDRKNEILKFMSTSQVLTADLLLSCVRQASSVEEVAGVFDYIQQAHVDLDFKLLDTLLVKLVQLGRYSTAKAILEASLTTVGKHDVRSGFPGPRFVRTVRDSRQHTSQVDVLNRILLLDSKERQPFTSGLVHYRRPASPLVLARFLESLTAMESASSLDEIENLLALMLENSIAITNTQAFAVVHLLESHLGQVSLQQETSIVHSLCELAAESIWFNNKVRKCSHVSVYDKRFLSQFVDPRFGTVYQELGALFKEVAVLMERWPSDGHADEVRSHVRERCRKLIRMDI